MAFNLVSALSQQLTPEVIGRLAMMLGLDAHRARVAVAAAVPALLAGLVGTLAAPGGAQKLAQAAEEQARLAEDFAAMLGGGQHTTLVDAGTQRLAFLLGPAQDAVATAVGEYAGITAGTANSLIGALAPLTLAVIGKEAAAAGPDAGGVAGLLAAQQDHIVEALPPGFFDLLQRGGIIDAFGGAAAAAASGEPRRAAAGATAPAQRYAPLPERPGIRGWLYWLIALLVLLGLGWYFLGNEAAPRIIPPKPPAATAPAAVLDVRPFSATLETIRISLAGVRDPATARAALPGLEAAAARVELLSGALGRASPVQQAAVLSAIGPMAGNVSQLCHEVLAIPGVAGVLRPALDSLEGRLAAFAA